MKWILDKSKITEEEFKNVEKKLEVQFPDDFKNIVLKHNGSSPEKMTYDTKDTKERIAEYLLSFNEKDEDNIIVAYMNIKDRLNNKYIPIMKDPFGNYICFDFSEKNNYKLYFWNHEDNSLEYIINSFSEFVNSLYE